MIRPKSYRLKAQLVIEVIIWALVMFIFVVLISRTASFIKPICDLAETFKDERAAMIGKYPTQLKVPRVEVSRKCFGLPKTWRGNGTKAPPHPLVIGGKGV